MSAAPEANEPDIVITRDGAVQIIRLNRPDKKNAITVAMYAAMADALASGDADEAIRAHVFFGAPGAFSAGNDMADFLAYAGSGQMGTEVLDFLAALVDAQKPVLCGVDGLAIGVGATMQMHCDLSFATPDSMFRTPFVDLGLVPEAGSSLLGPAIMGHQRAFAMLAMGEGLSAQDALDAGLIYKITEPDTLEAVVLEAAQTLANKPAHALKLSKSLLKGDRAAVHDRIAEEAKLFESQLRSDEARQAFMAFMASKG